MTTPEHDAEFKRFLSLGIKIAKRLKKQGVDMKLDIRFGPTVFEKTAKKRK